MPRAKRSMDAYLVPDGELPDELDALRRIYALLDASARAVAQDPKMTDRARRAELRQIARAMGALVPRARLRRAEKAVRDQHARIQVAVDPAVEAAPAATSAPDPALTPAPEPPADSTIDRAIDAASAVVLAHREGT